MERSVFSALSFFDVRLEGFSIRARGIDFSQEWSNIHAAMETLICVA